MDLISGNNLILSSSGRVQRDQDLEFQADYVFFKNQGSILNKLNLDSRFV